MNSYGGARTGAGRPRTPIDERRIIALVNAGLSQKLIAERFSISTSTVRNIVLRRFHELTLLRQQYYLNRKRNRNDK
jgi:DNA-binding CsgD family transcriptional regulator